VPRFHHRVALAGWPLLIASRAFGRRSVSVKILLQNGCQRLIASSGFWIELCFAFQNKTVIAFVSFQRCSQSHVYQCYFQSTEGGQRAHGKKPGTDLSLCIHHLLLLLRTQRSYPRGSSDRQALEAALQALRNKAPLEVPAIIGGKEVLGDPFAGRYWLTFRPRSSLKIFSHKRTLRLTRTISPSTPMPAKMMLPRPSTQLWLLSQLGKPCPLQTEPLSSSRLPILSRASIGLRSWQRRCSVRGRTPGKPKSTLRQNSVTS
jgi:hypothetical protein